MRVLLAIVILAALGWSGFWWWNASMRDRAIEGWLAERRTDGWIADAGDVRVRGYPSRVDTIVTGLELADPEAGWSWRADELQVLSLSYKPHHVIAVLPGTQVFSTRYETVTAASERLRGSVIFRPNARLELDHMTFEIEGMQLEGSQGWSAGIGKAILATRQAADGTPFAHDFAFNAERLALPEAVGAGLGTAGMLPAEIGPIAIDATLAFDRPWDRPALEEGNPALEGVEIRDLSLSWGKLDLRGRGALRVDAEGYAEGRLDLRARNWEAMLDLAENAGALDPTIAGAARAGLGLVARLAGDRDALEVPLDFEGGTARLGPVVIGTAPRLANR
jgi:hypothetical protein